MSNPSDRPWSEEERYTLLTEILKKAGVPSSHLVRMIRDFNISPSWTEIPLPPGRSLNSCQLAYYNMCQPQQQQQQQQQQQVSPPVNPGLVPFPPPRHELSVPPAISSESSHIRKRPLFSSEKPVFAPRPIQPRPAASTASYSSESGASALLSPGVESFATRGEPPRKRGRPSKAESERRKAAAEARGETYPPPRRSGSHKLKAPSTPASPSGVGGTGSMFASQTGARPVEVPNPELRYGFPPGRSMTLMAPIDSERMRGLPVRDLGSTLRELPRPTEVRQTLPSPQALQLGHREPIARIDPGERSFEPRPPDRIPFADSGRTSLMNPAASRRAGEPASLSTPDIPITTPAERRPE